eukprot:3110348-Prymnesium_polylepis.1
MSNPRLCRVAASDASSVAIVCAHFRRKARSSLQGERASAIGRNHGFLHVTPGPRSPFLFGGRWPMMSPEAVSGRY